ncbi:ABC transporter G family member 10 [Phalaenopsis equestris]|uniref:ABC transporter G family member 10 n=1 Tax=Phalaenopsis equestris TaxID=78828 RepID=UPI0009E2F4E2|nr:ABC transporter G family member 10 [Phalaenopsis equestris]
MDLPIKTPPELPINSGRNPRYFIETKCLSYVLPAGNTSHRTILNNVTCEARPGELLAIVGPSGAGKSTLLSVLAGAFHQENISGAILVNNRAMDTTHFRRISGYVPQDDAIIRARALLLQLGLAHVAGSRIGGKGIRGVSGGERRRVSIGVELVHNPAVLLLDEPTSGLDSASAYLIVAMLKSMAAGNGKTVVLTIHQPGFRILELLDRVVLISDGVVRHQGSLSLLEKRLEDGGHKIPPHINVLEYAMDATEMLTIETQVQGSSRVQFSALGQNREKNNCYFANSRVSEVVILAERFGKNIVRTKELFMARMIQAAVAGLGLGTIFMNVESQQAKVGFFAFSLTFLLSSSVEGLPMFLQEKRILMREVSRGAYRVSSYAIANSLVYLPFLLLAAILYASPVYWLIGLRREIDHFFFFLLVVWLVMLTANAFVACFGALVPDFIMGNSVIAGLMGSFFLFSGYFISRQSIPRYWLFMHYLSLFKYPFEALLLNEFGGEKGREVCMQGGDKGCMLTGGMFLRQQGMEEAHRWSNLGMMLGFICVYRIMSLVILWIKCLKIRR